MKESKKSGGADPNKALHAIVGAAEKAAGVASRSFDAPVPKEPADAAIALGGMLVGAVALAGAGLCMIAYAMIASAGPTE